MKKINFLIVLALLISTNLYAQNLWTNEVNLNFTVQSNTKVSSAVNENGIHIVYSRNGGISYALVNSQGTVIKYNKVIESEGSGTDFANVTAVGTTVYAIYYKNNDIKVARSTNLGDNWSASFSSFDLINTDCNKIVAYSDGSNIRITWSERRVNDPNNFDAHYIKLNPSAQPPDWTDYKRVSESDGSGGENPDLAFNSEKVEVNYLSFYQHKNRERLSNGNWNNSESFPYVPTQVVGTKPFIVGSSLNSIYKASWSTMSGSGAYIGHAYRNLGDINWTQNPTTLVTEMLNQYELYPHVTTSTADGKIHLIYWDKSVGVNYYTHRILTGQTFSGVVTQIPISILSNSLIASSNDLYLVHSNNIDVPGNIKFRHYDAAPLAPQNLTITKSANNHPYLTWNANSEPDMGNYIVEKYSSGIWVQLTQTSNRYYEDPNETYCTAVPPQQCASGHDVYYRLKAVDIQSHISAPCNSVVTHVAGGNPDKIVGEGSNQNLPEEYSLSQNYPNPFNPTTTINYQIKNAGLVSLKIFDVLGKEVAELVNKNQEPGQYSVNFDASNLPSGIYIYQLKANSFSAIKKLSLVK